MLKVVVAYISTGLVFLVLDAGWLTLAGPKLYKPELGAQLADKVNIGAAVAFYLLYVVGLVYFCVLPALSQSSWMRALIGGVLFGLIAYATYDLTNLATLRVWSIKVTAADLCWGAVASGVGCTAGFFITRRFA